MLFYFDMDGVLTALHDQVAQDAGLPSGDNIYEDPDRGHELYMEWGQKRGWEAAFSRIPPNRLKEMRTLMRLLHRKGHTVEILTSLGVRGAADMDRGAQVYAGKMRWLQTHYGDFLKNGAIGQVHTVVRSKYKHVYAAPGRLLIDDMESNIRRFTEAGGQALHYRMSRHDELFSRILDLS